jgi:glutaredoxin
VLLRTGTRRNAEPVIIFGSKDCHYCMDLKSALDTKRVPSEFRDVGLEQAAFIEMMEILAYKLPNLRLEDISLPVVVINEKVLIQPQAADVIDTRGR